ncbi:hypothetical protein K466DRAFT_597103 [Polyporus arcularius HHB13444]|uniref:Uncharacterized protein n=1 Tax=Polyporus arcularius HHB13444 TaxID=1314778 RepID=A0A5C3PMT2_9APHY|nr:hypothetical protein K466DRAFT_597103 [Polyporus arcularius HHB13444]
MPSRTCPDCVHPPNPPPSLGTLAPPPAYASGHVCTIFESLSTPIEHILAGTPDIKDSPEALKRCKDALSAIQAEGSPIGKNRPCIILGNVSNPDETTGIELILLGTFGRTPYDQLSLLDRLFVVPVSPNPAAKHTIHFHTSPAWDSSHCWAIAFIFKSTRPLKGLWPRARFDMALPDGKTMSTPSPHCVGAQPIYEASHDTRPVIVEKCRFNLERWSSQCIEDPTLAVECEEGFRVQPPPSEGFSLTKKFCGHVRSEREVFPEQPQSTKVLALFESACPCSWKERCFQHEASRGRHEDEKHSVDAIAQPSVELPEDGWRGIQPVASESPEQEFSG